MKKLSKIIALLVAVSLLAAVTGCSGTAAQETTGVTAASEASAAQPEAPTTEEPGTQETPSEPESKATLTIGIIQYVEHVALDNARIGFIDALADNGYINGDNITLDIQNAQADSANLSTISQRFVNNKVDMVLAIATPAAQSIASETTDIPILGTAITDYVDARLVQSNEAPGGNITGTSDMNPIAEQIDLLMQLAPDAKTVGIVYSSSEDNSVLQAAIAKEACEALGLEVVEGTVTSSNDVQQVTTSVASKVDAIYIPTDNIYAASMPIVAEVCVAAGVPTICGEAGMAMSGGLATLGINYYDLGYQTGLMAVKVLNGEAETATMPVEFAQGFEYTINGEVAAEMNFEIPADLVQYVYYPDDTDNG